MCRSCAAQAPWRREPCAFCGTLAIAAARTPAGAECAKCRSRRMRAKITCERCKSTARPSASTSGVCERCAEERVAQICSRCGAEEENYSAGLCARCSLAQRVEQLKRAGDPAAVAALETYLEFLQSKPNAFSVLNWMTVSPAFATLRALIDGSLPLTHEALDCLPEHRQSTLFLRRDLVIHGALPPRCEQASLIAGLISREMQRLPEGQDSLRLRTFATWKLQHELARAERKGTARRHSFEHARKQIRVSAELLGWLAEQKLTLSKLTQLQLDTWLAQGTGYRRGVRGFIRWTSKHHFSDQLEVAPASTRKHADPADPRTRISQIQMLLNDAKLDPRDRFVGLLVLIFAQRTSRIVLLEKNDVDEHDGEVFLRLGSEPLHLPAVIAALAAQLKHTRPHPKTTTVNTDSKWLLPGHWIGSHISESHLRERLWRLGIKTLPARNAATLHLGQTVPAAILADLLGVAENTAERWTQTAAGDWTRYAAARGRTTHHNGAGGPHSASALRAPAP